MTEPTEHTFRNLHNDINKLAEVVKSIRAAEWAFDQHYAGTMMQGRNWWASIPYHRRKMFQKLYVEAVYVLAEWDALNESNQTSS